MRNDNEIVEKVLAGSTEYYRELVLRYQQKVFSIALKISHNQKDAEDIVQEIFIQVYKSLSSFKHNSSFSTWIYRIAVNKCLDWKRKHKNQLSEINLTNEDFELRKSSNLLPDELFLLKNNKEDINILLDKIPLVYKNVLILYYYQDLSYNDIAINLNISKKTVESRLYRGKKLLRQIAKEEGLEWNVK